MKQFTFEVVAQDENSNARSGIIHTPHGDIETPAFIPVGTQGTVKSLTPTNLSELDVSMFFVNTYHMYLRPGIDVVEKAGGLHSFIGWNKPIITDSGGFQVFSLARNAFEGTNREGQKPSVKITEDGVRFQSHWDGGYHVFTPESSMEHQWGLGSDIHIAFDDCTAYPVTHDVAKRSMARTHKWAQRSLSQHKACATRHKKDNKPYQALYGAVQGSIFEDLRKESAQFISSLDVDGIAVGGVSVGETKSEMSDVLDWTVPHLPEHLPRHLLGVGEIDDIFTLVEAGMDTFDCVQPTRLARMGFVFSRDAAKRQKKPYMLDITKSMHAHSFEPIDQMCACFVCSKFTRSYIHHLFHVHELLAYHLATYHNIHFVQQLVVSIRKAVRSSAFVDLKKQWLYNEHTRTK